MSGDTVLKPLIIENGIDRNVTTYQAKGNTLPHYRVASYCSTNTAPKRCLDAIL